MNLNKIAQEMLAERKAARPKVRICTCGCGEPIVKRKRDSFTDYAKRSYASRSCYERARALIPRTPSEKPAQPQQPKPRQVAPQNGIGQLRASRLPDPRPRVISPDSNYNYKTPGALPVNLLEEERAAKRAAGIKQERGGPYKRADPELKRALGRALRLHGPDFADVWRENEQKKAASGHDLSPYPGEAAA